MCNEEKMQEIIRQLKKDGYRITSQRKLLVEVILSNEHSSCKEVYFAARELDDKVGIATVYRTVQLLEDMDFIKKSMSVKV